MPLVKWDDKMSVGVAILDRQHQKMLGMVNDLHYGLRIGHSQERLGAVLDRLEIYVIKHFRCEQTLLELTNYPDAALHKQMHDNLTKQFGKIRKQYHGSASEELSVVTLDFLMMWLINHIMGDDKECGKHLVSNDIK